MEVTTTTTKNELPGSIEAQDVVQKFDFFTKTYTCSVTSTGVMNTDFVALLGEWINGKGAVYFESLDVSCTFHTGSGNIAVAFTHAGANLNEYSHVLGFPNVIVFGANDFTKNKPEVHTLLLPASYTPKIFPLTGAKPLSGLCIAASNDPSATVVLTLKIQCSGPYVDRYQLTWKSGDVVNYSDFPSVKIKVTKK